MVEKDLYIKEVWTYGNDLSSGFHNVKCYEKDRWIKDGKITYPSSHPSWKMINRWDKFQKFCRSLDKLQIPYKQVGRTMTIVIAGKLYYACADRLMNKKGSDRKIYFTRTKQVMDYIKEELGITNN